MQRTKISIAIASLGVVGLALSHQASAAVATAASGNGDLLLVVTDTTTGATFYQDLGKSVSQMLPSNNASFSVGVGGDSNYAALLAQQGMDQLDFAVIAGAYGASAPLGGANDYLTTSGTQTYGPSTITNSNLQNWNLINQNVYNPLTSATESASGSFYFSPGSGGPLYSSTSGLWTWNGKTSINTIAPVGTTASNLFFLTGSGLSGHATPTLEGTATFNSGVFTFTSNNTSAVPLPAAVWLLGSGLAGLIGVGRRRSSAA